MTIKTPFLTDDGSSGSLRASLSWIVLIAGAAAAAAGFGAIGIPASYLTGPLLWASILGVAGVSIRVPKLPQVVALAVSGCLIGQFIEAQVLRDMVSIWPVVLLFACMTVAMSCSVGLFVGRISGIDTRVSIWGFMPGLAPVMIAMSEERGLDGRMVAVMQLVRYMVVILSILGFGALLTDSMHALPQADAGATPLAYACAALAIAVGIAVAYGLPVIPAGATLAAIFVAGAISASGASAVAMPDWLVHVAFGVIGTQIGLRVTPDLVRAGARAMPWILAGCIVLIALCAGMALILLQISDETLMTTLLATVPGSIDTIGFLAVVSNSTVSFVMTLQTVRLIVLTTAGPIFAEWFAGRFATDTE